ncbi:MAG: hypothetical protein FWG07_07020 [Treponema sp.]|nr:hypothetical protein [Treponema sp.]
MSAKNKVVLIGSGSQYTEFFLQEIFKFEDFKGCTVALVDRKQERLNEVLSIGRKLNEIMDWNVDFIGSPDRREMLPDAKVVYMFAAVNYMHAWARELEICQKNGLNPYEFHTTGPAGLSMAMRHVPLALEIAADMEELCPGAWLVLDNNPLSRIQAAVMRHSKTNVVGYCYGHELVQMALEQILGMTDRDESTKLADPVEREFMCPADNITLRQAGVNHMMWLLDVRDRKTGDDLYPKLKKILDTVELSSIPAGYKYCTEVYKLFGLFATPADSHVADYCWSVDKSNEERCGLYPFPVKSWFGGRDRSAWAEIASKIFDKGSAENFIKQRRTGWMSTQISRYMFNGDPKYFPALNTVNGGTIENISPDIIVETCGVIGPNYVAHTKIGRLPDAAAAICELNGRIALMAADATATGDKKLALQSLLIDPFIHSETVAKKILEDILQENKQYDTRFK